MSAYGYLLYAGVPTEECVPYESGQTGDDESCPSKCTGSTTTDYTHYHCKTPWMYLDSNSMKKDIQKNGSMETGFTVYQDFLQYKGGIYKHVTGSMLGGHAVRIVGWGEEEGVNYWIVANSWSESWGENGFFRIENGSCGFADSAVSCNPWL